VNYSLYNSTNKSVYPSKFFIYINSHCNQFCKSCDIGQKNMEANFYKITHKGPNPGLNAADMSLETFKNFVDDVKKFKPLIAFKGAEPLMRNEIKEFVSYVRKNGMKCSLTTNALLLEKRAEDLFEADLSEIQISIDGPPELHDVIRGVPKSFELARRGIQKLQELKKRAGKQTPRIYTNTTISNLNYDKLVEVFHSLKDLNLDFMRFQLANFVTEEMAERHNLQYGDFVKAAPSSISLEFNVTKTDVDVLYNQIKELKQLQQTTTIKIRFFPQLSYEELRKYFYQHDKFLSNFRRCFYPWVIGAINSNGDVVPFLRCYDYVMGNIKTQKFTDIWNNNRFMQFRGGLKKGGGALTACTRCCGIYGASSLFKA